MIHPINCCLNLKFNQLKLRNFFFKYFKSSLSKIWAKMIWMKEWNLSNFHEIIKKWMMCTKLKKSWLDNLLWPILNWYSLVSISKFSDLIRPSRSSLFYEFLIDRSTSSVFASPFFDCPSFLLSNSIYFACIWIISCMCSNSSLYCSSRVFRSFASSYLYFCLKFFFVSFSQFLKSSYSRYTADYL